MKKATAPSNKVIGWSALEEKSKGKEEKPPKYKAINGKGNRVDKYRGNKTKYSKKNFNEYIRQIQEQEEEKENIEPINEENWNYRDYRTPATTEESETESEDSELSESSESEDGRGSCSESEAVNTIETSFKTPEQLADDHFLGEGMKNSKIGV